MKTRENIKALVLLFIICLVCGWIGYGVGHRKRKTVIAHDTVLVSRTVSLPSPISIKEVLVSVPANVDTAAILAAYYTQRIYNDTLVNNEYLQFTLRDTVYNNRLLGRLVNYNFSYPVVKPPRYELYLTADMGLNTQLLMIGYKLDRWHFRAGYDMYNKAPMAGVGFTLIKW